MKKYSIMIEDNEILYTLVRSKRKTIGISIGIKDGVKVAAPNHTSKKQVEEVIYKNTKWILEKLKALEDVVVPKIQFKEGALFNYLGESYIVKVMKNLNKKKDYVERENGYLVVYIKCEDSEDNIKKLLLLWFREEANTFLKERLHFFSNKIGLFPNDVKIKDQKARFGSCSSKKNINLNWKLIMAPVEIIDYVIVHELCHLMEMNHSNKFWSLVETYMEDYQVRRKWLKENGNYIGLI